MLGFAIILLVGVLGARTDVAETVSCKFGGLFSQASGDGAASCGGDTTVADPGTDGTVGTDETSGTTGDSGVGSEPPLSTDPGGVGGDDDDDSTTSGDTDSDEPTDPFDQDTVDDAIDTFEDKLDGGWNGVRSGELGDIEDTLEDLSGAELDAVIADMSDDDLTSPSVERSRLV